jgi:two-component sensor histidine kinase/CheY-like chemotaxis protein
MAKDGRRLNISLTVSPLREKSGRIVGASKIARDITEKKMFESSQLLLMGELSHRVKNTLATVQAIATQSLRRSRNPTDFVASFTGRIHALARAHDLLSDSRWEGIELSALIRDQVQLGVADDRIVSRGPELTLAAQPALHLAMVLHELGTNARKYGALSVPQGKLVVDWQVVAAKGGRQLELQWSESGGPAVLAPNERGFGTRLIEDSLLAHGGEAIIKYRTEGLAGELRLPLPQPKEQSGAYGMPKPTPSSEDMIHRARLEGKRILVVEDETLIAMEIESALRDGGCDVAGPVGDVEEALRLIASGERYDAALLDTKLSGYRVDSVAAALAQAGVPFAFITGYGAEALPEAFRQSMIVPKPFDKHQLLSALAVLLQRRSDPVVYPFRSPARAKP